jgi:hypothetical protein
MSQENGRLVREMYWRQRENFERRDWLARSGVGAGWPVVGGI